MRPLLSYYGGKQRLASRIVAWLPRHTVYVEPFCGGSAVFYAKGRPRVTNADHYREVLNDHDQRLMTVYRVCQDERTRQALLERLTYTPWSRVVHQESRAIQQTWDTHDAISQAWAIVVDIQQSFAHRIGGGWGTGVSGECLGAGWANWREALPAVMARLREVHLECDDALAVIRRWDSPQTCVYCDPPYLGTQQGPYQGYTSADWHALVQILERCQGSFVLSGYAACLPLIPAHWEVQTIDALCSASAQGQTSGHDRSRAATAADRGDRHRTEYLWRVDRSAGMRAELQALFGREVQTTLPFDAPEAPR